MQASRQGKTLRWLSVSVLILGGVAALAWPIGDRPCGGFDPLPMCSANVWIRLLMVLCVVVLALALYILSYKRDEHHTLEELQPKP